MKFTVIDNATEQIAVKIANFADEAALKLAVEVEADTRKYLPLVSGTLANTTKVVGNTIIYPPPYSRYLYYGKYMVDAATGKGPMKYEDDIGNIYIRYRKGAKLIPTSRPLKYNKNGNSRAGPFWFERSKADNKTKWIKDMERLT